jgi:hypothetical protein
LPTKTVLLVCHAERPTDPVNSDLWDAGFARAESLAACLPHQFGKPDFLFVPSITKHTPALTSAVGGKSDEDPDPWNPRALNVILKLNYGTADKMTIIPAIKLFEHHAPE